ncbi:MAG: calcium-binding protein [Actinomycetota bacterium]|nr:calcium-binding protein [Actinomycetota bacterium]
MSSLRSLSLISIASLVGTLGPVTATAASCSWDLVTRRVTFSMDAGALVLTTTAGGVLHFNGEPCDGTEGQGRAEVTNTESVLVIGTSEDDMVKIDESYGGFAPGYTEEDLGGSELEIEVQLADGSDTLAFNGGDNDDAVTAGLLGMNINDDDDGNDITFTGAEKLNLIGERGDDRLSAMGDPTTGSPVTQPVYIGGTGGNDILHGGPHNDLLIGAAGDDRLSGGLGDDVFKFFGGKDTLSYADSLAPVTVDLANGVADGEGHDRIGDVERVVGSIHGDVLFAGRHGTHISGGRGADKLWGADGSDRFFGASGDDTLSGDQLKDLLVGGPGADRMTGGPWLDELRGGEGEDACRVDADTDRKFSCEGRIPRSTSPPDRIHVVVMNLKEMDAANPDHITKKPRSDLRLKGELKNFALRLAGELWMVPDVLLFSEAVGVSTNDTARFLTKRFGDRFKTAIAPKTLYIGASSRRAAKRNTSIVINARTMERVNKGGFITMRQPRGEQTRGTAPISQDQAHVLLREKQSGHRVAAASIHLLSIRKFKSAAIAHRRKRIWAENLVSFMRKKYGEVPTKVLGGEFNQRRCNAWRETLECDEFGLWKTFVRKANYEDAVYESHSRGKWDLWKAATRLGGDKGGKRINYVFAKPNAVGGWHDQAYKARIFTKNFISDHRFISALVGA